MTTRLDTFIPAKVTSILNQYGKTVSLIKQSASHNVDTGVVTKTPTTTSVKISPPVGISWVQRDKTGLLEGDKYAILDNSVTPEIEDHLSIDSRKWVIKRVDPIYSGDLIAAYEIYLRA